MAFNGSGVFNRLYSWVTDKANAVAVTASRMDGEMDGFATGLTGCITKDGQTATTARIPFASGTSAAAGSTAAAAYGQTNNVNTGIYFPNADEVAITCGGTQVLDCTAGAVTVPSGRTLAVVSALTVAGTPVTGFASGTSLLFQQTSAPTGWTKQTTHNDKALRLVSGTVSSGGTVAFSTCFSRTATDNFTILQTHLPNVTFANSGIAVSDTRAFRTDTAVLPAGGATAPGAGGITGAATSKINIEVASGSIAISAQGSAASGGSGTAIAPTMDMRVQYVDVTICTKD